MADDESVQVSEDTSVSEEANTSTNEETPDTDVDLDDFELSDEEIEAAASTDETEEAEESETNETADTEPPETEEESVADEEQTEATTPSDEETKRHNAEMAQRRIAEREAREAAKREQQEKYLQDAEDAKDLALRQLQIDAYNNRVESVSNKLQNDLDKAVASIDLLTKGTPEQQEKLLRELDKFEALHVKRDANGDPIEVTGNLYQYLQEEAEAISKLTNVGARQETKAKNKAKARTDTLPTRAPKQAKVDPDIAAFDEEANRW